MLKAEEKSIILCNVLACVQERFQNGWRDHCTGMDRVFSRWVTCTSNTRLMALLFCTASTCTRARSPTCPASWTQKPGKTRSRPTAWWQLSLAPSRPQTLANLFSQGSVLLLHQAWELSKDPLVSMDII